MFEPYNASDDAVTWESSDEKVVTVDDIGTVKAVAAGKAEVIVKDIAGKLSAKCKVTVTENATSEKIKKGSIIKETKTKASYKVLSIKALSMTVEYLKPTDKKVKNVSIKATVTYKNKKYKVVKVADKAFMNCKKLKKVTIGKNVKTIGKKAFANCKALKTVQIPKGLKKSKIAKDAFAGCSHNPKIKVLK